MIELTELPLLACAPVLRGPARDVPPASGRTVTAGRTFVAGPENRLAAAALRCLLAHLGPPDADRVSDRATNAELRIDVPCTDPSTPSIVSPLVLFGPPGTGKTHVARGLVEFCRQSQGAEAAEYLTAREYREQLAAAVNEQQVPSFRARLRNLRLLAIDDIHRFGEHDSWQQDLLHTIDALAQNGALLVVTTSRPLTTLDRLLGAIISRLQMGLVVPLSPPVEGTRLALVRQAAGAAGREIADEAAILLARRLEVTPRELLGAVACLASDRRVGCAIDTAGVESLLDEHCSRAKPDLQQIITIVSRYYSLSQKVLKSASRKRTAVSARALVIYLARQMAGLSYQAIGHDLGGRDHTTIMHGYRQIEQRLPREPALQMAVADLQRLLWCP